MANWQRRLKLTPEWDQAQEGEISIQTLARVTAKRLRSLAPFENAELDEARDEIAEQFEAIADDADADTGDYDNVMADLYDWADTRLDGEGFGGKKVCWVETF